MSSASKKCLGVRLSLVPVPGVALDALADISNLAATPTSHNKRLGGGEGRGGGQAEQADTAEDCDDALPPLGSPPPCPFPKKKKSSGQASSGKDECFLARADTAAAPDPPSDLRRPSPGSPALVGEQVLGPAPPSNVSRRRLERRSSLSAVAVSVSALAVGVPDGSPSAAAGSSGSSQSSPASSVAAAAAVAVYATSTPAGDYRRQRQPPKRRMTCDGGDLADLMHRLLASGGGGSHCLGAGGGGGKGGGGGGGAGRGGKGGVRRRQDKDKDKDADNETTSNAGQAEEEEDTAAGFGSLPPTPASLGGGGGSRCSWGGWRASDDGGRCGPPRPHERP